MGRKISVYLKPDIESQKTEIVSLKEMIVSESGWGIFPKVYSRKDSHWLKIKEGWIFLDELDFKYIQFYEGDQDISGKEAHDHYYHNH